MAEINLMTGILIEYLSKGPMYYVDLTNEDKMFIPSDTNRNKIKKIEESQLRKNNKTKLRQIKQISINKCKSKNFPLNYQRNVYKNRIAI